MELCDDDKKFNCGTEQKCECEYEQERAIRAFYPNDVILYVSDGQGEKRNIKTTATKVFKFSDNPELLVKNASICKIYSLRHIPAPKITPREFGSVFFEEYPRIDGVNLYQAVKLGIGASQIQEIYRDIVENFAKMDRVSPSVLYKNPINHVHNIAHLTTAANNNHTVANAIGVAVRLMNCGDRADKAFYHTNISPKNIIVSSDGIFVSFVDADEIAISDRNYAFAAMAAKYKEIGMNINDLFRAYYQIGDYELDESRVRMMANANALGQKLLWNHKKSKTK